MSVDSFSTETVDETDEEKEDIWNSCMSYVKTNLKTIKGRAKKFIPYAVYDMDDFLQEAFLCAIEAVNSCPQKCNTCAEELLNCETYPIIFWGVIKDRYSKMATLPSLKKLYGTGSTMPIYPIDIESYSVMLEHEKINVFNTPHLEFDLNENEMKEAEIDMKISEALSLMNEKSRQAWEYYLGRNGCGRPLTRKEIAKKMNYTHPQRISQLLSKGLIEVAEKMSALELNNLNSCN